MAAIAIALLWILVGAIILAGGIWLVIYGIKQFIYPQFPPKLEQGIWFVYLILVIIYLITAFVSGGTPHPFRW